MYLAGMPGPVSVVGMAHGVLFMLYLAAVAHAQLTVRWPIGRALMVVVAAVLPFGPFLIDGWLKREERAVQSVGRGPRRG